jgi:two-component system NarL family sensor kinase
MLEIQDMGQGIPPEKLALITQMRGGSGVGLGGMQQRLKLLGGRLELESGAFGTIVRAMVPVHAEMLGTPPPTASQP